MTKRPATEDDDSFLFELFKAVRSPDFAYVPLTPDQLEGLMRMQYAGQRQSYAAQFPDSDHEIVLIDGEPAGRIWIYRTATEHRLVDIALLPQYQNRGAGSALVKEALAASTQAGMPLCCSVSVRNHGSLRFHHRLGFRIVSQDEVYYELAAVPDSQR